MLVSAAVKADEEGSLVVPAERLLSFAVRHVLCSVFSGSARASERDRGWLLVPPLRRGGFFFPAALRGVMEKLHRQPLPAVVAARDCRRRCRRWSGASGVVIRHLLLVRQRNTLHFVVARVTSQGRSATMCRPPRSRRRAWCVFSPPSGGNDDQRREWMIVDAVPAASAGRAREKVFAPTRRSARGAFLASPGASSRVVTRPSIPAPPRTGQGPGFKDSSALPDTPSSPSCVLGKRRLGPVCLGKRRVKKKKKKAKIPEGEMASTTVSILSSAATQRSSGFALPSGATCALRGTWLAERVTELPELSDNDGALNSHLRSR
ncbi:hypothetical protein HPB50_009883 [Hyalomma asiaticum]|uniref:Uncharacterized protein n=1 Tax=Hyalomma asiaticum TaxID=266040 RepID=A0ACB7RNT4_HYAAI|nr:hypothetical protein HPB50_009883 [Hyalomma asiaticum]